MNAKRITIFAFLKAVELAAIGLVCFLIYHLGRLVNLWINPELILEVPKIFNFFVGCITLVIAVMIGAWIYIMYHDLLKDWIRGNWDYSGYLEHRLFSQKAKEEQNGIRTK